MRRLCLVGSLVLATSAGGAARAATITVTSLADNTTLDGQVTLREAIMAANTDTSVDGSVAGSGPDEIVFATGPGVITLSGTQLPTIVQQLTITGLGATQLALDGAQASRLLEIGAGVTATVSSLTIRNGRVLGGSGGGILNLGNLSVARSVFSHDAVTGDGGAIRSNGSLSIDQTIFSANSALNGGALDNRGSLQVAHSTFEGNFTGGLVPSAGGGGALAHATGNATITDSAFSSNRATNGGAIVNQATITLANSTLTGNSAQNNGGGISSGTGVSVTVTACTFTLNRADDNGDGLGNGGGINAGAAVSLLLHSNIVAGNLRGTTTTAQDVGGAAQAASSFNVIGVDTGLAGISDGTNGNQIGTAASPLDPLLGPLQDNGGPTFTRAVLPGSPALDRGSAATCLATDQRGVTRPIDGDLDGTAVCDVGAYEEAFVVSSTMLSFYTLTPCRVVDTRGPAGPTGGPALAANTTRVFPIASSCGVPADAKAVALNATVVNETDVGDLRLYPAGAAAPNASTINFVVGKARANNAVVPLGAAGRIAVQCDMPPGSAGTTNLVIDVFGYLR